MKKEDVRIGMQVVGMHKWNYILGNKGVVVEMVADKPDVVVVWAINASGGEIVPPIRQTVPVSRISEVKTTI